MTDKDGPASGPGVQEPPPESTLRGPGGGVVYEDAPAATLADEEYDEKLIAKLRRDIEDLERWREVDHATIRSHVATMRQQREDIEALKARIQGLLEATGLLVERRREAERRLAEAAAALRALAAGLS